MYERRPSEEDGKQVWLLSLDANVDIRHDVGIDTYIDADIHVDIEARHRHIWT